MTTTYVETAFLASKRLDFFHYVQSRDIIIRHHVTSLYVKLLWTSSTNVTKCMLYIDFNTMALYHPHDKK